jgi:hypothetical protein
VGQNMLGRLEEARIADAEWRLPATNILIRRGHGNSCKVKAADNQASSVLSLVTANGEFDLDERRGSSG